LGIPPYAPPKYLAPVSDEFNPAPSLAAGLAGRYEVGPEIGRGGMSSVYAARDLRHEREVALKVIRPNLLSEPGTPERFLREIRYAATLTHPHILPLYDSGTVPCLDPFPMAGAELLYYVMPRLSGESLRTRLLREHRLPIDQALRLARSVAFALDYAHRRRIVHRDLKPENILLHEGEPLVADFGVARALYDHPGEKPYDSSATGPGIAVGTPTYMSPEQASADPEIDGRSDQYSLACVLYELLTGQPPFTGTGARATMTRHLAEPVPPLRGFRPEVPPAVELAILTALEKDPAKRFPTMAEFADALVTPLSGLPAPVAAPAAWSVAVLPFANASPDPDSEYFADGMTDEVINALAQVPGLVVASRSSSFALKGQAPDARQVGRLLNVAAVLEGSVRKAGARLRITAQLTETAQGRLLWSDRYDADDRDLFAVQDRLAATIVRRLQGELDARRSTQSALAAREATPPEPALPRRGTANLAAYNLYLRGRYAWNRRTAEGVATAIRCFEQAIALDPEYALAYAGLSDAWALQVDYRAAPVHEGLARARAFAEQAIALDDTVAEAHNALAWVVFIHDWDWEKAGRAFQRALELDPRYATARQWHSWYLTAMGQLPEAVAEAERAVTLDPASMSIQRSLGWVYMVAGQAERGVRQVERALVMNPESQETYALLGLVREAADDLPGAETALREALQLEPDYTTALATLARVLVRAGRRPEAEVIAERMAELARQGYVSPSDQAKLALGLGDHDAAFAALERAYAERRGWLAYLKVDPLFEPVRNDPRHAELVARMRLP
jgi:serine/threonine protein kinase/Tfp pilus assembly protein PilF